MMESQGQPRRLLDQWIQKVCQTPDPNRLRTYKCIGAENDGHGTLVHRCELTFSADVTKEVASLTGVFKGEGHDKDAAKDAAAGLALLAMQGQKHCLDDQDAGPVKRPKLH